MSYRLTFSLASLILILGFVFASTPVLAHTDATNPTHEHPEVKVEVTGGDAVPDDPANDTTLGLQAFDKNDPAQNSSVDNNINARVVFGVTLTFPAGATKSTLVGSSYPAIDIETLAAIEDALVAFDPTTNLALDDGTVRVIGSAGTPGAGWTADAGNLKNVPWKYTAELLVTLAVDFIYDEKNFETNGKLTAAEIALRDAAKDQRISDGEVAVNVVIPDGLIRSGTISGNLIGQVSDQDPVKIQVVPKEDTGPVTPPTTGTPPAFDADKIKPMYWWEGEKDYTSDPLPLATDDEPIVADGYAVVPDLTGNKKTPELADIGLQIAYTSDNSGRIIRPLPTTGSVPPNPTPPLDPAGTYKWTYTASDYDEADNPNDDLIIEIDFLLTIRERLVPGQVAALVAKQVSHVENAESIRLTWVPLPQRSKVTDKDNTGNDGGSPVTHYRIEWTGPNNTSGTIITPTNATTYLWEQNLEIAKYTFTVAAVNSLGDGEDSAPAEVNVVNLPSEPRNVEASIGQVPNRVTLNWLPPVSDGGDPIFNYHISIINSSNGNVATEVKAVADPKAPTPQDWTYQTPVLALGGYTFRVAAENECGIGPLSFGQEDPVDILANQPPVFTAEIPIAHISATVNIPLLGQIQLPPATDPEGQPVTYAIDPALPAGVNFNASTRVIHGTPTAATPLTQHTYTASDPQGGSASLPFSIIVHAEKPMTIDIPTANSSSERINLGQNFANATLQPFSFAVLVRDVNDSGTYDPMPNTWLRSSDTALPDLEWFFGGTGGTNGGTLALYGPTTGTPKKDLVISEIMWGTDSSLAVPERSQWIEFYNATNAPISLYGYHIQFHRSQVHPSAWADAVDYASNVGQHSIYFGHHEFPGKSGRTNPVDTQGRLAQTENLISIFRAIDHVAVEYYMKLPVPNRGERDKPERIPNGGTFKPADYPTANIHPWRVATPGAEQLVRNTPGPTTFAQQVIINEIGNSANDDYDWIELHNTTASAISLKNWDFTMVVKEGNVGKEKRIFHFPDNDTVQVPAKGYLVIARSHPKNHGNDLAAGIDVTKAEIDQLKRGLGEKDLAGHPTAYYYVNSGLVLPNDTARRLFVLRNAKDKAGQPSHVQDTTGTLAIAVRGELPSGYTGYDAFRRDIWNTGVWPFQGVDGVHGNVIDGGDEDFRPGKVYQRNGKNAGIGEKHVAVRGYTGVGYDRHASVNAENGGTPGYHKDAVKGDKSAWANQVTISEIMLVTDEGEGAARVPRATRLPQWFEIYNASLTEAVSLNGWKLEIQNDDTPDFLTNLHGTLTLPNVIIQPNQTVLVVSSSGLHSGHFPDQRTINVFTNGTYRQILGLTRRGEPMLNPEGFYIELRDHKQNPVDEIGNLGVSRRTGTGRRDNFGEQWEMPSLHSPDGHRTSLIRIYDNKNMPRSGLNPVGGPKNPDAGWVLASNTNFRNVPSLTYYGNHRDFGTPGYRGGGPLPVSLSKFRPERLDSGDVVIRWATESELNNAGFNILRSETRDGEFTKVNTQLIAGQGTTSEKTTYTWKDTTAKPNVVYYYEIQDVSIDGHIQTLRVSRLKGNVTAAGKATTTWGELKALQ